MEKINENWFVETSNLNTWVQGVKIKEKLFEKTSKFQKVEVLDTFALGKLLLLDGKTMVSDKDEFIYHEVMSHIPVMVHPNPKRVLIIGGGDAGIVTQLVKHECIEKIDLVEIDEEVINASRKYFPHVAKGLDDKRVNVHCVDGLEFIKDKKNCYEIILIDSTDPENFAAPLFTESFYKEVNMALTEDGLMLNQTENPFFTEFNLKEIYQNLRNAFPVVKPFTAPMLIYPGVFWSFGFNSKKYGPTHIDPNKISYMSSLQKTLKWYNLEWHRNAFALDNMSKKQFGIDL